MSVGDIFGCFSSSPHSADAATVDTQGHAGAQHFADRKRAKVTGDPAGSLETMRFLGFESRDTLTSTIPKT
jgi:hypothetical protein